MTSLSKKSGYFLVVVFATYLLWGLVSYTTVLTTISVLGGLITLPILLVNSKKLPPTSEEKVRRFVEKAGAGPIAHRGGKPENTLAALSRAKRRGVSGVELDLALTEDGHAVLLHDATVDRTSINGSGPIEGMTLSQAKELDFGSHCGEEFAGEKIPTLKEAIALCLELGLFVLLEIKSSTTDYDRAVHVVTELFLENPDMYEQVAVVSFFPDLLYKLRSADPDIICGFSCVTGYIILAPDGLYEGKAWWKYLVSPLADVLLLWSLETWILPLLGVKLILPHKDMILKKQVEVKRFQEKGFSVIPWTVNEREEMTHFKDVLKIPYITDLPAVDEE